MDNSDNCLISFIKRKLSLWQFALMTHYQNIPLDKISFISSSEIFQLALYSVKDLAVIRQLSVSLTSFHVLQGRTLLSVFFPDTLLKNAWETPMISPLKEKEVLFTIYYIIRIMSPTWAKTRQTNYNKEFTYSKASIIFL